MSRVLVTGGAGFIGSHVVDRLLADGCEVTVLDSFDDFYDPAVKRRNLSGAMTQKSFRLVEGDIRDQDALTEAFDGGADAVIHLAARAGVRPSLAQPSLYYHHNVLGTLSLLEAACAADVGRCVLASSSSVYGDHPVVPFREDLALDRPISPYAATKLATEHLAHVFHERHGLAVMVLRFFTSFGPRQRPEMAIHRFARRIEAGEEVVLYGKGTARDYTFVDDVVEGVVTAMRSRVPYDVCNIGNARMVELTEVISTLERHLGKKARLQWGDIQAGDVRWTCADVEHAREVLGFEAAISFDEGVRRFVEWFRR